MSWIVFVEGESLADLQMFYFQEEKYRRLKAKECLTSCSVFDQGWGWGLSVGKGQVESKWRNTLDLAPCDPDPDAGLNSEPDSNHLHI